MNWISSYLQYFSGFEETRMFLAAECEQDDQADSAPLLLEAEAVSVPGGPGGVPRAAAAALPTSILDQILLPAAERHRLRRAVGLHVRGVRVCVRASVTSTQV